MKKLLLVLGIVAALGVGVLARDLVYPPAKQPGPTDTSPTGLAMLANQDTQPGDETCPAAAAVLPVATVEVAVVLDPTTSTESQFSRDTLAAVISQTANWIPAKPTQTTAGTPSINGLNLRIKMVGSNPYAYGASESYIQLPGVSGLPARPDISLCPSALDDGSYQAWTAAQASWSSDYDTALAALDQAVERLEAIDLTVSDAELSGIKAAVSALASATPAAGLVRYLVASDLDETTAPQTAGSLDGQPLIIVHACPEGVASLCQDRLDEFSSWATGQMQAGSVSVYRPEQLASAVAAAFEGAAP